MSVSQVAAPDGAMLTVNSVGDGPAVVLLHGGGVNSADYRRLIDGLATRLTVHSFDRRGYGNELPIPSVDDALAVNLGDIGAVLAATGATMLLGHSGGAFYALQAARVLPVTAVAVYDPAVSVDGLFPMDFVEPFRAAVDAGDSVTAMVEMGGGIDAAGPAAAHLPKSVQRAAVRLFARTPIGARIASMLPATLPDVRIIKAAGGPAADYSPITARTLLACGAKSPAYYGPICDNLAEVIADATSLRIPKASHNSANVAGRAFVQPFLEFFTAA